MYIHYAVDIVVVPPFFPWICTLIQYVSSIEVADPEKAEKNAASALLDLGEVLKDLTGQSHFRDQNGLRLGGNYSIPKLNVWFCS